MAAGEIFVDTAGFLALWDARDSFHEQALVIQAEGISGSRPFLTTDYVMDETVTLLLVRHSHAAAVDFLEAMEETAAGVRVEWTDSQRFHAAAQRFRQATDKRWSFTDCVSFEVMRENGIREAFTADRHFQQAGFLALLKP